MDGSELRDLLKRLHAEIKNTKSVDGEGRELLRHLNSDITELLERTQGPPIKPQASLLQNLERAVEYFEVTHPVLATLLADLMTALAGI